MPAVPAFHDAEGDVYHTRTECSCAIAIPRHRVRIGTGDRPPCAECARVGRNGGRTDDERPQP
jgi:hypothetical protein